MKLKAGEFVRLRDGRVARVHSYRRVQLLDGEKIVVKEDEVFPVLYSAADSGQLLNALFDLASRVSTLEYVNHF